MTAMAASITISVDSNQSRRSPRASMSCRKLTPTMRPRKPVHGIGRTFFGESGTRTQDAARTAALTGIGR